MLLYITESPFLKAFGHIQKKEICKAFIFFAKFILFFAKKDYLFFKNVL